MNDTFYGYGHKNLFDFELLAWALRRAQFGTVERVNEKDPLARFPGFSERGDDLQTLHAVARAQLGSGVSTLITGYCLADLGQGHLISIEHDEAFAARSRDEVARHVLGHVVTIIHAPLCDVALEEWTYRWYRLPALCEPIDVLIVDGPPATLDAQARYPAVPLLADRLRDGALILVDDGARAGEREIVARWAERFPDLTVEFKATEKRAYVLGVRRAAGGDRPAAAAQ